MALLIEFLKSSNSRTPASSFSIFSFFFERERQSSMGNGKRKRHPEERRSYANVLKQKNQTGHHSRHSSHHSSHHSTHHYRNISSGLSGQGNHSSHNGSDHRGGSNKSNKERPVFYFSFLGNDGNRPNGATYSLKSKYKDPIYTKSL